MRMLPITGSFLVNVEGEQRISSALNADSIGTTYKSTNSLIHKHKERLKSFGLLPFQKDAKGKKIPAYLNEDQAIFLITLSKNTELVVEFKHRLVTAFSNLRRKQAIVDENHAKVEWQERRELGKLTRHTQTDAIQMFLDYAGNQGSSNYPLRGYSIFTRMVNNALQIDDRETASEEQLHLVATAELLVAKTLIEGMNVGLAYKNIYQRCRAKVHDLADLIEVDKRNAA
ncbi:MAG: Rha family transcriptional regulator [Cycloclasticus pugetii]